MRGRDPSELSACRPSRRADVVVGGFRGSREERWRARGGGVGGAAGGLDGGRGWQGNAKQRDKDNVVCGPL